MPSVSDTNGRSGTKVYSGKEVLMPSKMLDGLHESPPITPERARAAWGIGAPQAKRARRGAGVPADQENERRGAMGPLVLVALCSLAAGCGQSTTPTPAPPAVTSVAITGTLALPAVGQTSQLVATAAFADGTSQVVTNQATWLSSNPTVATVTTSGLVAALTYGTAVVTATYRSVAGIGTVTITLNMTGTWKGTVSDSSGSADLTSVLTQAGATISGTSTLVYTSGTQASGSFNGMVSNTGSTVSFIVTGSGSGGGATCTVTLTGTGQISNVTFTGSYGGTNSCSGPITFGSMTLTKQ